MSSGAAVAVALREAKTMREGRIVVILPDGGERYLSTPLFVDKKKTGLLLFNTLTRKKEEFVSLKESQVSMYTCGPTLCQPIHIGQCRRFLFADLVRRYLEFNGYTVNHVMNVTDLDDRTIEGAEKAGLSLKDFTEEYYQAFLSDLNTLNVKRASLYPRASENVEAMIHLIDQLIQKGYAYEKFRSVYFDISRFREYGRLSKINLEKIRLGKTVDLEEYDKDNPRDFTLLKRSTLSELKKGIFYKTQWGNVRPSWHLECPAMAMKFLGEKYDIHTSGIDLVFPHHENAIAIAKALTGMGPANYWLHNELVRVEGKPYSRFNDGHGLTIQDFLKKGFSGRVIRYWLLSRHYRKPLNFSWSKLETAKNTLHRLDNFVQRFYACPLGKNNGSISQLVYNLRRTFVEALDDDFNMARALGGLFQFIGRVNQIMDTQGISEDDRKKTEGVLQGVNAILGVMNMDQTETAPEIDALIKEREEARKTKNWSKADQLRSQLKKMGIEVVDGANETLWRRID
jgi:cysteinyl-tRNA synthetase